MKKFFEVFFDFITGGFFNYIGAADRVLFSKRIFSALLEESFSNYVGMIVVTMLLFIFFFYIKFFL